MIPTNNTKLKLMKSWFVTSSCFLVLGCTIFKKEQTILAEHVDRHDNKSEFILSLWERQLKT